MKDVCGHIDNLGKGKKAFYLQSLRLQYRN